MPRSSSYYSDFQDSFCTGEFSPNGRKNVVYGFGEIWGTGFGKFNVCRSKNYKKRNYERFLNLL